ncbi:MAG: F0F1 ATP synthase subunit epsilon [Ruminococcaceae bacterium]|nr:F0F1 ATP synthase subunit epsilon [Oscillospiraceae bacterium]
MKPFKLVISSPDGDLFRDNAVKISLRGYEGDLAVMAGHIPFVTPVKPCECVVEMENNILKKGNLKDGILTVSPTEVILLSGTFKWNE